jgi:hypothetical protein
VFDFSKAKEADLKKIRMLNFVFNPAGAMSFRGTVLFDDLKIGSASVQTPSMTTIPAQFHYIQCGEVEVPFRGIIDPVKGAKPITVSAKSFNPSLIPDPTVVYTSPQKTGILRYSPASDKSGTALITVTVSGNAPGTKVVLFDATVEKNLPPRVDKPGHQITQSGHSTEVLLTGIDDGNPNAIQAVAFAAISSDTSMLPDPVVIRNDTEPSARLLLSPKMDASGRVTVSLRLQDDGGTADGGVDTSRTVFDVRIFSDAVNHPPTLDAIEDQSVLEDPVEHSLTLTGVSNGDPGTAQTVVFDAASSNPSLVPDPVIEYRPPDSTAVLKFAPTPGRTGIAVITVRAADDGGTPDNNGDAAVEQTFTVRVRRRPTIGFEQTFDDGVLPPEWPAVYGGVGEDCHRCSVQDGILRISIDKNRTGNVWAGLWFNIAQELDLSQVPYISITMKTSKSGTPMLIFLWDAYDHYNTGGTVRHNVSGEFTEYFFDFTGLDLQGDGTKVDFTRIKALLLNFDPGNRPLFLGDFYFDDFRVGTYAHRAPATPRATMDPIPDFTVPRDCGAQTVRLTGLGDGVDGSHPVGLKAESSLKTLIPVPEFGPVVDGKTVLTFVPAAGKTGSAQITVTASAEGSKDLIRKFRIFVAEFDAASSGSVEVDTSITYQTIDGFGAFMGSEAAWPHPGPFRWQGTSACPWRGSASSKTNSNRRTTTATRR